MLPLEQQPISVSLPVMGNQIFTSTNISRVVSSKLIPKLKGCIVVQTCDAYKAYWDSFLWSFNKYWENKIDWPLYFCTEKNTAQLINPSHKQLQTGVGTHSRRLAHILDTLEQYEYVFYMLEDFWLTNHMTHDLFTELFEVMETNNWDSLRVAPYMPTYYKLESTNFTVQGRKILKFAKESDWHFSQQASFWKRDFLRKCVVDAKVAESDVSSSIAAEIAMDKYLKQTYPNANIYLYNYHWYPISGSVWRGKLTQMGEQIEFLRQADALFNEKFVN